MARNQTLSILSQILRTLQTVNDSNIITENTDTNKTNNIGVNSFSSRLLSENNNGEKGGGREEGGGGEREQGGGGGGGDVVFRPNGMKKNDINEESKESKEREESTESVFHVESLAVGEVMMIAIIVTAIQSNLIPTFKVDFMSIRHQDNAVTVTSSSTSTASSSEPSKERSAESSSESKITYPSLTFADKEKTFQITFSMVPIFGEMVIYAMKKILIDEENVLFTSNIQIKTSGVTNNDVQKIKKKKIQTLYIDPNNFIFKNSDVVEECSGECPGDCSAVYEEDYIRQFHNGSSNCMNDTNYKNDKNERKKKEIKKILDKRKLNNCLNSFIIGEYKTKFQELTLRIEKTLLEPLLFEK